MIHSGNKKGKHTKGCGSSSYDGDACSFNWLPPARPWNNASSVTKQGRDHLAAETRVRESIYFGELSPNIR